MLVPLVCDFQVHTALTFMVICLHYGLCSDGAVVESKAGGLDGVMEGEEGGGWEVGDEELELPPDLVS